MNGKGTMYPGEKLCSAILALKKIQVDALSCYLTLYGAGKSAQLSEDNLYHFGSLCKKLSCYHLCLRELV